MNQNPEQPGQQSAGTAAREITPAGAIDVLTLEKHRPLLVKYAMQQLRDPAHAEDVVQETLLAALQAAGRFQGNASVRTWLTAILKNKILDHFRRQRRHASLEELEHESGGDDIESLYAENGRLASPAPSGWGNPEAAFAQERFFGVLEDCMSRLPANTARAFHMREVLGMSTDEISEALGTSTSNSGVLLHRARKSLRGCLQEEWFDGERPEHLHAA